MKVHPSSMIGPYNLVPIPPGLHSSSLLLGICICVYVSVSNNSRTSKKRSIGGRNKKEREKKRNYNNNLSMLRFVVARLDFGRARALVTPGGPVANYDTAGGG